MPKQTFFNLPESKRAHIIDVALAEFGEYGLQAASVSRIVATAGIAKGSFYQYFEDLEDLYQHLFALAAEKKGELLAANPPPPGMDIYSYLRWLAEVGVAFEAQEPALARLGYQALRGNALPASFVAQSREMTATFFRRLVAQAQAQGDIAPGVDPEIAAFLFATIFNELGQYLFHRLNEAERDRPDARQRLFDSPAVQAHLDQVITILEHGLRHGSQESG